jgi:hypothetical protein
MVPEIRERGGTDMVSCVHIRAVLRDRTGEMARRRMSEYSAVWSTLRIVVEKVHQPRIAA